MTVDQVRKLLGRITASVFMTDFEIFLDYDRKFSSGTAYTYKCIAGFHFYVKDQIISEHEYNTKVPIGGKALFERMPLTKGRKGRLYLQFSYKAPCTKTSIVSDWKGRKWYLSSHMTEDEVIKTAYAAFQACINHEIMEGFKVDNIILFNPHVSYKELLKVSHKEIKREIIE